VTGFYKPFLFLFFSPSSPSLVLFHKKARLKEEIWKIKWNIVCVPAAQDIAFPSLFSPFLKWHSTCGVGQRVATGGHLFFLFFLFIPGNLFCIRAKIGIEQMQDRMRNDSPVPSFSPPLLLPPAPCFFLGLEKRRAHSGTEGMWSAALAASSFSPFLSSNGDGGPGPAFFFYPAGADRRSHSGAAGRDTATCEYCFPSPFFSPFFPPLCAGAAVAGRQRRTDFPGLALA